MLYKEIAPAEALDKVIKCFWLLEHDYREEFHTHEHLWADAHAELIFTFGEPYYLKTKSGKEILPRNFVIGPFKRELKLYSDGFTGLVAVRFLPWGVHPFAQVPVTTLINSLLPAGDVFGKSIEALGETFENTERNKKIELLQAYFTAALSEVRKTESMVPQIASRIAAENGIGKMSDVTRQFGVGARHLQRIFKTEIGLSPKMFSRIVRFNHARRLIEKDPDISLAHLTFELGYTDQAHFCKNFRELFDISPADFKRQLKEFKAQFDKNKMDVAFLQDA